MNPEKAESQIRRYLRDQAVVPPERSTLPAPGDRLRVSIVIPAYDELDRIEDVIDSLEEASRSPETFEALVVVNNPESAPDDIVEANLETLEILGNRETAFDLHLIDRASPGSAFPDEASGVGHARRLGMDLAVARLAEVGRFADGLIGCLDGDSPADPGYVDDIVAELNPSTDPDDRSMLAGVCRYRHPIPDDPEHARAIVAYESWMRYFELGLHHTSTPYAYQSIGSCMVVSAAGYALADGVPTREALSDFYLLQKITKVAGRRTVANLRRPRVRPSARPSGRVPRGTGPSVRQTMHSEGDRFVCVEPPDTFEHLRRWFRALPDGFRNPDLLRETAAGPLRKFIGEHDGWSTLAKLREHAPDAERFVAQVYQWFDSLKIVKYANERRRHEGSVWLFDGLRRLLDVAGHRELAGDIPRSSRRDSTLEQRVQVLKLLREHELELGR
jgi:hypothetical protein